MFVVAMLPRAVCSGQVLKSLESRQFICNLRLIITSFNFMLFPSALTIGIDRKTPRRLTLINRFISVALILLWLTGNVLADENHSSSQPPQLKLCWQLPSLEPTIVQPASQNERLFVATFGGKLTAVNAATGEPLWRTELGGEIVGQMPVGKNLLYVASQIAAGQDRPAAIIIRALSIETGLTVWQGEISSAAQLALALQGDYLLAASGESGNATGGGAETNSHLKVIALSADKGELRWTQTLAADLSTALTTVDETLVFATADKVVHLLKIADGREIRRLTIPAPAREKIVWSRGLLLFGDKSGNVFAIDAADGKTSWTLRLGGAAQSILPTDKGVLISSLDDFVYFQNILSGKRIWRKRLASRPLGAVLLNDAAVLLAVTGQNSSIILDLKKGNVLSQVNLGAENVAVSAPFASRDYVSVPTAKGLLTFAPLSLACPAK